MTDVPRTHLEWVTPDLDIAVFADGDIVIDGTDANQVLCEPPQIRELQQALWRLPREESLSMSLGEGRSGEEVYIEWDGSTACLSRTFPSNSITLTETEARELEKSLSDLGY